MIDFGNNVAELRKTRGLTQIELASLLDVQPRMIGRWEQGVAKPHFDYIVKLAKVLEVSFDRLLNGNDPEQPDQFEIKNRKLKELCKKIDHLKTEDQEVVCHFLDMAIKQDQFKQLVSNSAA